MSPITDAGAQTEAPGDPPPRATPAAAEPLPPNCQAPLVAIEEVSRFLVTASTHATVSNACVDGPGVRVRIDEIHVCPARGDAPDRHFDATYRVTTFREGDTRACTPDCEGLQPRARDHRIAIVFTPDGKRFTLVPPTTVPGLPADATPATAAHDGKCYRESPGFVPRPVTLR
jgi:hypothetical protein